MFTIQEFLDAVDNNAKIAKGFVNGNIDLNGMVFITNELNLKKINPSHLLNKINDVIPTALVNTLFTEDLHGSDGYRLNKKTLDNIKTNKLALSETVTLDMLEEIEVKRCIRGENSFWKTKNGSLKSGNPEKRSKTVCIRSDFSAAFNTLDQNSKNRTTILLLFSTVDNKLKFIDAFELDGTIIVRYLGLSNKTQRSIKLSTFINYGIQTPLNENIKRYKNKGYICWENDIRANAPCFSILY
jgi:hypothetical protein